ncbi:MAG TPA: hypothetical protein VML75_27565 [Kofleriaceae bacterium]|nr:hypothetical protein [Kofleriaceae bacterium]
MNPIYSISASISAAALAVALAACGASDPAPAQPTTANHPGHTEPASPVAKDQGHAHHHEGDHDFPAAVTTFHDVMAPRWHAEAGEQRQTDTCGAIASFRAGAAAIVSEPVPEKAAADEAGWRAAAANLVAGVDALEKACAVAGRPGFADAFHELHERFHALVGLVGHKEHGEHGKH